MKTLNFLRVPAFAVLMLAVAALLTSPTLAQDWVRVTDGRMPANALRGGNEADGTPLYVARAHYEGTLHPGKARANAREAFIAYGGREIAVSNYEVYVGTGTWQPVRPGWSVPAMAIAGGREANLMPLYIARAAKGGGIHPGKSNGREAYIPYGGREEYAQPFEVLVARGGDLVTLYSDCDFRGASATFGAGRYNTDQLGAVGNDQISSVKVPPGFVVKLYEQVNYVGNTKRMDYTVACLADRVYDFNDKTSSMEIYGAAHFGIPVCTIHPIYDEWLAYLRANPLHEGTGNILAMTIRLGSGTITMNGGTAAFGLRAGSVFPCAINVESSYAEKRYKIMIDVVQNLIKVTFLDEGGQEIIFRGCTRRGDTLNGSAGRDSITITINQTQSVG